MADVAVAVRVAGLSAGQRVTVEASTTDEARRTWLGFAAFHADGRGAIDLATADPTGVGTYRQPEAMGLFWSMTPTDGKPDPLVFPFSGMRITLRVRDDGGRSLATREVTRLFAAAGVTERDLTLARDGVIGHYYAPANAAARRPAVLAFGGAEGGLSEYLDVVGALLASHGFPTLVIGYFAMAGLPPRLTNVPLEYFVGALTWLRGQPGVDPEHVLTYGVSRGSEAALLLGALRPDLVQGVVGLVPTNAVHCSFPDCIGPDWNMNGGLLPYTRQFDRVDPTDEPDAVIPVERIGGPVLLVCGQADSEWTSCPYAQAIEQRLVAHAFPNRHVVLSYPDAGHGVGRLAPYQQDSARGDTLGEVQAWPQLLSLLDSLAKGP